MAAVTAECGVGVGVGGRVGWVGRRSGAIVGGKKHLEAPYLTRSVKKLQLLLAVGIALVAVCARHRSCRGCCFVVVVGAVAVGIAARYYGGP